ncbi:MAG TPA: AsmA-like C-terminal region-containing protein [Terracidiphilus sp.]
MHVGDRLRIEPLAPRLVSGRGGNAGGTRKPFWRRHRQLKWALIVLVVGLAVTGTVISVILHRAEPMLRAYIISALEEHFHARVELDSFHVSLANGLRAEGKGLRIWPPAEVRGVMVPATNLERPLITLDDFRFRAPLHYSPTKPIYIAVVQMKGLTLDLPAKPRFTHANEEPKSSQEPSKMEQALIHIKVQSIVCADTRLILEPKDPEKLPLTFAISSLKLTDIQTGGVMKFQANLTNARPVGAIVTQGTFGPWTVKDPGESAIQGKYDFEHANLGDFKGIAGTLDSTGTYQGTLRNLNVDGLTNTPDFAVTHFGTPMALHTQFHAEVDATNGDTWLEPVNATLGKSNFTVRGEIVGLRGDNGTQAAGAVTKGVAPHKGGHLISLMVDVPRGRMEDFLRLTSKSGSPLLTGLLAMQTSLEIPPGKEPLHQRIKLKGRFLLKDAQFTDVKIQDRMADLSLRGQGRPKDAKNKTDEAQVRATMQSDFTLAHGTIHLPDLQYDLPGADVALSGTYLLDGGALDFKGTAKMQATVSQMVGGWKGFFLKPADRFFKKDGAGTRVPIHINGTNKDPHFGVDFGRMKATSPQRPDEKHP